ncbi:MAG TPA: hypothetical protein EYP10_09420, partial [Armatimonadetes bacterium]|nr:hypothetical protein [Armatimonadota bacterium]
MVGSHRVLHDNAWISIGGALASVIPSPAELPPLTRNFYDREVTQVAIELLGKLLLRSLPEGIAGGIIVEVEAYLARNDPANHAYRGCTIRNRSMFGPPGHAYVYRIHQQHCLNVVTEPPSTPSAV